LASLIQQVEAARRESAELRQASVALRAALEGRRRETSRRRTACMMTYARSHQVRAHGVRSAWSDLVWEPVGHELDHVLVGID